MKLALLAPRRERRRRRHRTDESGLVALLEHFDYGDPIYDFASAISQNRSILHQFDDADVDIVLDVGGYVGEWCMPVAARTERPIHVFEPSVWARERLEAAVAEAHNVHLHHVGLGPRDETVSLARIGPGSTHLDSEGDWERADVPIRSVRRTLDELGVERAFLKINIEGAEYDLLDDLIESGDITRARHVLIQFHEWLPRAHWRRWRIRRRLRRTHSLAWDYPWIWERWDARVG